MDFHQSRLMDRIADYVQRGGRFGALSDADLVARWFTSFRAVADAPLDPCCRAEHEDVEAELGLRNIEPPYDQAQSDVDRFMAATDIEIEAVRRDPERMKHMMDGMVADLIAFEDARDNSN